MNNTPNTIKDFFSLLESSNTQFIFTTVNTLPSFLSRIRYSNEFIAAKDVIVADPENLAPNVVERIQYLLGLPTDNQFRNKYDLAISGYLLLLSETAVNYILPILKEIRNKNIQNLWWTNAVGNYIVQSSPLLSSTQVTDFVDSKITFNISSEEDIINTDSSSNTQRLSF